MKDYRQVFLVSCFALAMMSWTLMGTRAQPGVPPYHVKAGDTLEVTVAGEPAYSGPFVIGPTGTIAISTVGREIVIAGMTLGEAKAILVRTLTEYLKDPIVSVRVSKFRVPVSGDVERAGSYEMVPGETAMDAVSRAGGVRKDVMVTAVQLRRLGTLVTLSPDGVGESSVGALLQPGDEIVVARSAAAEISYTISGAVEKPGVYPVSAFEPTHISQALVAAGRWTADANPREAILTRKDGQQVQVDLTALDAQAGSAQDLELGPGDTLFVPRLGLHISVLGAVITPGAYLVEEGTTYFAAVTRAGGPRSSAVLKKCCILRMKPELHRIPVDLQKIIQQADAKENQVVQDGDIVWVEDTAPPNTKQPWYQSIMPFLWLLR